MHISAQASAQSTFMFHAKAKTHCVQVFTPKFTRAILSSFTKHEEEHVARLSNLPHEVTLSAAVASNTNNNLNEHGSLLESVPVASSSAISSFVPECQPKERDMRPGSTEDGSHKPTEKSKPSVSTSRLVKQVVNSMKKLLVEGSLDAFNAIDSNKSFQTPVTLTQAHRPKLDISLQSLSVLHSLSDRLLQVRQSFARLRLRPPLLKS